MNATDLKNIGSRIQLRRKQKGLTQEQLADSMNVSIQMISNLERGNKAIRIDNLLKLSEILQVSTDYILTGRESERDISDAAAKLESLSPKSRRLISAIADICIDEKI